MIKNSVTVIFCLLFFLCFTAGCRETENSAVAEMKIGYIDTDQLLVKWEKYRDFGDKYYKERQVFIEKIAAKSKEKEKLSQQDAAALQEFDKKWEEQRQMITEEIRGAVKVIAAKENFSVVLDNTSSAPVIEYGGTDITLDVLEVLKSGGEEKTDS